jgi:hypothetical protein
MAKKSAINKTKLIKDAMAANPEATPKEIADSLSKHGISAQYVSTVKFNMNKKSDGRPVGKPGRRPATASIGSAGKSTSSSSGIEYSDLVKAKSLADQMGGVQKAKAVLDALNELSQ